MFGRLDSFLHDRLLAGHWDADHHTCSDSITQFRVQPGQLYAGDIEFPTDAIERLFAFHRIIHSFFHSLCLCLRQVLYTCLRNPNGPTFLEGRNGETGIGGNNLFCRHIVANRKRIERFLALNGMISVGILLASMSH